MQLTKQNKQAFILYCSTLLGVLMGVLTSVINTRALIPAQYGDVRYVQNIIAFVSSLLLFGFFTSGSRLLALSENEEHSRQIRGIMCVILGISILVMMLVMTVLCVISNFKGNESLMALYMVSIPFCSNVLLTNYINTTAQGDNHIGRLSIARLVPSVLYCLVAFIIFKLYGATPVRMLALYNGLHILVLAAVIISTKPSFANLRESWRALFEENKTYGFNIYVGSLVGVSTSYIAGITLGIFCADNTNVGFYTLALTISSPLSTLPAIIGTTYFKRFATDDSISLKIWKASGGLTLLTALLFIVFIKYVVLFLYDNSYSSVATYAAWLAIGMSFHGLGDMINRFLGAHGQGRQIRNAALACGVMMLIGSTVFVYFWGIIGATLTKILSSTAYFAVLLIYYLSYVKQ